MLKRVIGTQGTHGTHDQMLNAMTNGTSIDVVTLDQIWLGEFAQKGYLTDLTNRVLVGENFLIFTELTWVE